jgi:hypothetical protein
VTEQTPEVVLYRAAALTGLVSKFAAADLNPESYKRIAEAVCDIAQAIADEATERARKAAAQQNRKY